MVTGTGFPPVGDTRKMPDRKAGENRMTPSRFQVPPRPPLASQTEIGGPPAAFTVYNFSLAKYPSEQLSADQNGNVAPSVPGKRRAVGLCKGRTQSFCPPAPRAT